MSDASSALAGLGSDLAFTISFAIARELLDGANESGISQDELVAVVLALGVIFAALLVYGLRGSRQPISADLRGLRRVSRNLTTIV